MIYKITDDGTKLEIYEQKTGQCVKPNVYYGLKRLFINYFLIKVFNRKVIKRINYNPY